MLLLMFINEALKQKQFKKEYIYPIDIYHFNLNVQQNTRLPLRSISISIYLLGLSATLPLNVNF